MENFQAWNLSFVVPWLFWVLCLAWRLPTPHCLLINPALLLSLPSPATSRTFNKPTHSFFQMCLLWNQMVILELWRQKCFFGVYHGDICSDAGPQACVYGPDRTARFLLDCVWAVYPALHPQGIRTPTLVSWWSTRQGSSFPHLSTLK